MQPIIYTDARRQPAHARCPHLEQLLDVGVSLLLGDPAWRALPTAVCYGQISPTLCPTAFTADDIPSATGVSLWTHRVASVE